MLLYSSNRLPALRLTFPGNEINEYRVRQGCVEFRKNEGPWRTLEESDVQLHFSLHTTVADWLKEHLADGHTPV